MKDSPVRGQTSNIGFVFIPDSSSTTGAGKTGLTNASAGLNVSVRREKSSTVTAYTGANIGAITTLGTWANPGSGKVNFKEIDSTNMPGLYELHFEDAIFNTSDTSRKLLGMVTVTGGAPSPFELPLLAVDSQDGVRMAMTSLPNAAAGANTGLPVVGTQIPNATSGASGGLPINDSDLCVKSKLQGFLTTLITEGATGRIAAAFQLGWNVASSTWTAADVNQSGDAYNLVNTRLTAARAGYLDNLNVGGAVASHADILAINQSASKHVLLTTVGQYAPGETYTIEARTFAAADGSAVNADTTPTLTATGTVSGSLNANLSAATNPATGVYRWTYTPGSSPTLEQIRFDLSATISSATFTLSTYAQTVDQPSVVWTATDQSHLTTIFNKLPTNNIADETLLLAAIGSPLQAGNVTVGGYATNEDPATILFAATLPVTPTAGTAGEALKFADTRIDVAVSSRSTLTQAQVTGGAYALSTDSSGRVILAATGLDQISVADPGAVANWTTLPKLLVALIRRFLTAKSTLTATQLKTFANDGVTVNSTQTVSDDGTTQTQGAAS